MPVQFGRCCHTMPQFPVMMWTCSRYPQCFLSLTWSDHSKFLRFCLTSFAVQTHSQCKPVGFSQPEIQWLFSKLWWDDSGWSTYLQGHWTPENIQHWVWGEKKGLLISLESHTWNETAVMQISLKILPFFSRLWYAGCWLSARTIATLPIITGVMHSMWHNSCTPSSM